jgi:hypothetical protein
MKTDVPGLLLIFTHGLILKGRTPAVLTVVFGHHIM